MSIGNEVMHVDISSLVHNIPNPVYILSRPYARIGLCRVVRLHITMREQFAYCEPLGYIHV